MARQSVTIRLEPVLVEQIEKIASANRITRTQAIEELLIHSLENQDEELASSFLLPRLETILVSLFERHLWNLRSMMVQAATEATISSRLSLLKFAADNDYSSDQLSELRNQAFRQAVLRLRKRGVPENELPELE